MCQGWSLMELRVRYLEISAADIQSFISCLLANINTAAFRRSWGENKENNETISTLSLSLPPFEALNNVAGWKGLSLVEKSQHVMKTLLPYGHTKRRVEMAVYLMSQHPVELLFRDGQPLSVCAVHHQNDELQCRRQKSHRLTSFQKRHLQQWNATQ